MDHLLLRKLTNAYQDIELYNLGFNENHKGPYLVRQVGYPPGDPAMNVDPYILLNNGVWLLAYHFATFSPAEQDNHLFQSRRQLVELLEVIGSRDVQCVSTLPAGLSDDEILRRYRAYGRRLLEHLQRSNAQCILPPKS
jgi:hypothetical protein